MTYALIRPQLMSTIAARDSLSGVYIITSILADIPLFSVGLLSFGAFTVVLALRRVNILSIYLYLSTFFAFGAAILDLCQILSRVHNDGRPQSHSVTGFVTAREVGLALSLGLRFVFYWVLVAWQPPGESASTSPSDKSARPVYALAPLHSASWETWGVLGFVLRWLLLGLIILITLFQILWRTLDQFHHYAALYIIESAIEIAVTILFILKLMVNVLLYPQDPWWSPFRLYAVPIMALLFGVGVSIGNLVSFAFTETPLGRFLQALEVYILIIFILIFTFRSHRSSVQSFSAASRQDVSTQAVVPTDAKGTLPAADNSVVLLGRFIPTPENDDHPSRAGSPLLVSRLSSQRIPDQDRAELGIAGIERSSPPETPASVGPRIEELKEGEGRPKLSLDDGLSPNSRIESSGFLSTSIPSYYGMNSPYAPPRPLPDTNAGRDSPIYGLEGIIDRLPKQIPLDDTRSSSLSFDELLRRQTELDRSIAALRLFSPNTSETPAIEVSTTQVETPLNSHRGSDGTSSTLLRRRSTSALSDFSLSNFPKPPDDQVPAVPLPERAKRPLALRSRSQHSRKDAAVVPKPIGIPDGVLASESLLVSSGTQYDVTSFIGNLMEPSGRVDTASGIVSPNTLVSASATLAGSPDNHHLGGIKSSPTTRQMETTLDVPQPPQRPTLAGIESTIPYPTQPTLTSRILTSNPLTQSYQPRIGPSLRPRPIISGPRPPQDSKWDQAYEQPRPPPLPLQKEKLSRPNPF